MSDERKARHMDNKSYEMLWDCAYCGQTGLLGVTHRHCANCGAAQDPDKRYFPPAGQEQEVQGHVFVGTDRACPACSTPMAAKAGFCTTCGSPMEGGADVRRMTDEPPPEKQPVKPAGSGRGRKILFLVIGVAVAAIALFVLYKPEKTLTVQGHAWSRSIAVEQFAQVTEKSECQSMPTGATLQRRYQETRSRKVKDGEDCQEKCSDKRVDQGDGTFRVDQQCKNECTPRYREEHYQVSMCQYQIGRWRKVRDARTQGTGLSPPPAWPEPGLAYGNGTDRYGSEREGGRSAVYKVDLKDSEGARHTCEIEQVAAWAALAPGSAVKVAFNVLGNPSCDSLQRK
jgi:hypothetical protein